MNIIQMRDELNKLIQDGYGNTEINQIECGFQEYCVDVYEHYEQISIIETECGGKSLWIK